MSDDGADLNMPAEGAMKAVLGGEQPEQMSDAEFERMIRTAELEHSYGGCANRYARLVLEHLEAHPEDQAITDAFELHKKLQVSREDRENCLEQLTGFMAGWGVNAARHILKMRPVANPAIVTINV
jgi:hypothetical protein